MSVLIAPPLHGLAYDHGRRSYRFGLANFLAQVDHAQLHAPGASPRPWPFRRLDRNFTHLQVAARHVAFKLEVAASLYATAAREYGDSIAMRRGARNEKPAILLDAILVYLRILPDLAAAATPYFYAKGNPAWRSFREQIGWFTEKRSGFDPGYEAILGYDLTWFDGLAGQEEKGLRDSMIHRFGQFQFPIINSPSERAGEVTADLFSLGGYHEEAHISLKSITTGLFEFLSRYVSHFNGRVLEHGGWEPFPVSDGRAAVIPLSDERGPDWLFPSL